MTSLVDYLQTKLAEADKPDDKIIRMPPQVIPLGFGRYQVLIYDPPVPENGGWFGHTTVVWGWKRAHELAERYRPRIIQGSAEGDA